MKRENFTSRKTPPGYRSAHPLPDTEELARYYAEAYYQDCPADTYQSDYSPEELSYKKLRSDLVMYALEKAFGCPPTGDRFLEIGCGEGFILKSAVDVGYEVLGVDFSDVGMRRWHPDLVGSLRTGDAFEELKCLEREGELFSVVVLQNILEHVIDPERLLGDVRRLLKPGGVLSINVPNDYSHLQKHLLSSGMVDDEYWFQPPDHLHYFNVNNLRKFVLECGYEIMDEFADFPVEFYLMHSGSNYARDRSNGSEAHQPRFQLNWWLGREGSQRYLEFIRP